MKPYVPTNAQDLDRRITLLSPLETRDAMGGVITSWVNVGDFWAAFNPAEPGRKVWEFQQAGQKIALAYATFRIRFRAITAKWRIIFDGLAYDIVSPPTQVGRKFFLDLDCRALNPDDLAIDGIGVQAQTVDLAPGDESKAIVYATAFASSPSGVYCKVITPAGGYIIESNPDDSTRTAAGFTAKLGAAIPAAGYKLSVIAVL